MQEKDKILIDLLSAGSGSLDYAQKLLVGDDGQGPGPSDQLSPTWCKCGVCIPMPTPDENKCCGKRTCITSYALFQQLCIDRNTLILAIRSRTDIRTDPLDVSMNSMRKQAYRQYVLWTLGRLGKGERRVNPSCVVKMVRAAYPSADGAYMGFRYR